jgi:beta-lactamase class A
VAFTCHRGMFPGMLTLSLFVTLACLASAASTSDPRPAFADYTLDFSTPTDAGLQSQLADIDTKLRERFGMTAEQTAVGVLDLAGDRSRLAMLNPDRETYAASVPKIGILLAYFALKPGGTDGQVDPVARKELGQMIKVSSNEMASKYSHELGLKNVQAVLDQYHFYNKDHGGGIWVGKHYGKDAERTGSPVGDNSHAATVRQLLRYYLLLEQGKLVSPAASKTMREIFESPDVAHDDHKFTKGLAGREGLRVIRKSGTWQNWLHDTAVITGGGRHYVLVALTEHPKGDEYLEALAPAVDDLMTRR